MQGAGAPKFTQECTAPRRADGATFEPHAHRDGNSVIRSTHTGVEYLEPTQPSSGGSCKKESPECVVLRYIYIYIYIYIPKKGTLKPSITNYPDIVQIAGYLRSKLKYPIIVKRITL